MSVTFLQFLYIFQGRLCIGDAIVPSLLILLFLYYYYYHHHHHHHHRIIMSVVMDVVVFMMLWIVMSNSKLFGHQLQAVIRWLLMAKGLVHVHDSPHCSIANYPSINSIFSFQYHFSSASYTSIITP